MERTSAGLSRRTFLAAAAGARPRRPRNIVLVLADDVGYECFEPYGSRQYRTPSLAALARAGVRFDHCYATPLCTPTRVALMTGQNNVRNYTDFGALHPGEFTFTHLFRKAGYATAVAGKWQLQGTPRAKGVDPKDSGFDSYCLWNTSLTGRERYWKPSIERDGKLIETRDSDYGPDLFAGFLTDFIHKNRTRPFFVYYSMALTHSPFVPTPDSENRQSKDRTRNFADMVAYCDKLTGRLAAAIQEMKLWEDTLFVFTADNGTEHTITSELGGRQIRGDKGCPTGAGTHVPLIVAGGGIPGGRVVNDLIDFTDFLPTFAEAAGLKLPPSIPFDGVSFWPQLIGQRGKPREALYNYYFPRPFASKFDTPYAHPEIRYAWNHRHKLYSDGRLFDIVKDPEERRPLPAEQDDKDLSAIRQRLRRVIASMPAHGARIPEECWRRAQGVPPPRWQA